MVQLGWTWAPQALLESLETAGLGAASGKPDLETGHARSTHRDLPCLSTTSCLSPWHVPLPPPRPPVSIPRPVFNLSWVRVGEAWYRGHLGSVSTGVLMVDRPRGTRAPRHEAAIMMRSGGGWIVCDGGWWMMGWGMPSTGSLNGKLGSGLVVSKTRELS